MAKLIIISVKNDDIKRSKMKLYSKNFISEKYFQEKHPSACSQK